jgi:CheY-like chemotaxis protein
MLVNQIPSKDSAATDPHNHRVFLEVEDTGCGMSDDARKRMLDPFFSTKGPGRGLGLASLQGITRAHNGIIHIASSEGEGTLFRIEFPVDGPPVRLPPGPAVQKAIQNGDGCRVLVVDDDDDARNTTAALLQSKGFTVETASSGQAAIDRVQGEGPDVHSVVLDMSMPRMSGVETFREIRLSHPDVHVVFISGFFAHEEIRELVQLGQVRFVQKPFLIEELASAILSPRASEHPVGS